MSGGCSSPENSSHSSDFLFCTHIILYILYMMTAVSSACSQGAGEKTQISETQATQPQKRVQATAEQLHLAQVLSDKNESDLETKAKQLMEVTEKSGRMLPGPT